MSLELQQVSPTETLALRCRHRDEMNCQVLKDSIHRRTGWTRTYLLLCGTGPVGFGSVAIAGPWTDRPTVIEFYLIPEVRHRAFEAFELFVSGGGARFFETQTNDRLYTVLALSFGQDVVTEKIVFGDGPAPALPSLGATLRAVTPPGELRDAIERRQGGGEWLLELNGAPVGKAGLLFHYNRPYGDVYMEIAEPHRRRGLGSFLVQQVMGACRELGAIPAARCDPSNTASRRTLLRAGFVPLANNLCGSLRV